MAISSGLRFEVLERDNFTCQYCGRSAPSVVLHLDHVRPRSKGGADTFHNLVTACAECNAGKAAKEIVGDEGGLREYWQDAIVHWTDDPVSALRFVREVRADALDQLLVGLNCDWAHSIFEVTGLVPKSDLHFCLWLTSHTEQEIIRAFGEVAKHLTNHPEDCWLGRIYVLIEWEIRDKRISRGVGLYVKPR